MSNRAPQTRAGAHSLAEILSQPSCWGTCLKALQGDPIVEKIRKSFGGAEEWLFVGCGSSYYIAQAAAASWVALTGGRARAVPASELLFYPEIALAGSKAVVPVLISRSGRTSETVQAAEFLERAKDIRTLAVTCAADQPLERSATHTLRLLQADEKSTVMTRSFTSMLLGLQYLAARVADDDAFVNSLCHLPGAAEQPLNQVHALIRDFVTQRQFADYVCLGQGPFFGIACESTLKLTEMSVSYAQCFHALEFRHGPKSIVSPETLIIFLLSESNYAAEREVLEEVKGLGGTTMAIANRADDRTRKAADLVIEFGFDVPELGRLAPYTFAGQLLGLYTGLKKGLDPDQPRNLSRVVILDENESPEKPEHAAL